MTHHVPAARIFAVILAMSTVGARTNDATAEPVPDPVVFVTPWLERGDHGTQPRPDQIRDTISIAAAPGEYEPATISIRSVRPLQQVRLEVTGDLMSDAGDRIDAEAVREGIDDYRFLATLKRQVERAAEAGRDDLVQGGEEVFAQARAMVTMDNYGKAFLQALGDTAEASAYNRPRVEPDLPLGAYDALRQAAADQATTITAALTK